MPRPIAGTYPPFFETYIEKVEETNLLDAFRNQGNTIDHFFDNIPADLHDYAYAPGKWTMKEMLQHIIDTERIFNYRSLCFARQETASLPGFDENLYAEYSNASARSWESLVGELKAVRKSTNYMYESFTEEMLNHSGIANNKPATALALGYATVGHLYHHVFITATRYLQPR